MSKDVTKLNSFERIEFMKAFWAFAQDTVTVLNHTAPPADWKLEINVSACDLQGSDQYLADCQIMIFRESNNFAHTLWIYYETRDRKDKWPGWKASIDNGLKDLDKPGQFMLKKDIALHQRINSIFIDKIAGYLKDYDDVITRLKVEQGIIDEALALYKTHHP